MSRPINITSAVTFNPTGTATGANITGNTSYPYSNGYNGTSNTSSYARLQLNASNTSTDCYIYYTFSVSGIPSDATINSVSCVARIYANNRVTTGTSTNSASIQLYNGTTAKGSAQTGIGRSAANVTISNTGSWTVSELNNIRLRIKGRRSSTSNAGYLYFYGADLTVNYSINGTEYEVSFVNDSYDTTTDPSTTQYIMSGGEQEIKIYTPDVDGIAVKDNGTDITNSLVYHTGGVNTASIGTVAGASYGFTLDGQYYKSQNVGHNGSAALCRLNITASTEVTLTVHLVNYAEATYDFGLIGNVDANLGTTSATTNDSYYWIGNTQDKNTEDEQTVTMTIPSGIHHVDFKFIKDNYSEDGNDALWFRYELPSGSTEGYYTYTISNISADHVISLEDVGGTFYDVNASSTYAGATVSPSTQSIREGRSATVNVEVEHLYEIVAKDNGVIIQLPEPIDNASVNFIPSAYIQSASTAITGTTYPPSNGLANTASTNYAAFTAQTVANAVVEAVYSFDCSSIPQGAIIDSVTCAIYARVSNATYLPTSYAQLYHEGTAKGSQSANINGTQSVRTFDGGSWTREELNDVSLHFIGQRGTSTNSAHLRMYGANLLIEYHVPCSYTISNVQTSHTITIEEAPYYTISTASTYANASASVSPTKLYSGLDANITVSVQNLYEIKIKLDGTDVTSNFTGSNGTYTYTLQNVTTNHALTIEEAPYYTVTVNNSYQDATITVDPPKGYYGIDVDVRIQVSDIDEIKVMDNGVSVMANIINVGSGLYRYTINAINADHTITVIESTRYNITATSNYSEVTISPSSVSVIEGHSQTFVIEGDEDTDLGADIILLDNNVDVTSQMTRAMGETGTTSTVLGTFDSANSQYLDVYTNSSNVTYYETNAEGHGCDYGISNSGSTRSSFYPSTGAGSELIVFYNFSGITIPEGATITNVSAKAAVAPAYNGAGYTEMSLQLCIGTNPVGEATPISSASTDANEHTVDGGSGWTANDLANAKIKMYGVRNNTNSNNDSSGKRDNLNMCGADLIVTYSLPGGYLYTISNVQTAHTLVVNEVPATYYTVTASSSYQEATITPASQSVRQNHTAKLQISAASIYDIVVKDNGVNVTSELVQNETGFTYTTQKITVPHTITVEESESFAITTSSQYQGATISPATQSVRQGMSAVTYVEVGNPDEIAVLDNSVDVTEQLVLTTPGESYTASGILSTFDTVNSQYVGIYSSYAYTNAEGHSAAEGIASTGSTRSAFYPATGAGSELFVYYDFGEVTGIPSDAVIYNVSANVAFSTAYSGQGYSDVTLQLCIGTTPVGEATHPEIGANSAPVSARTATVDGGSGWTLNDITNAKILLYGVRNDTNSNNDTGGTRDNLCMHGADIIVTYGDGNTFNGYTYTLNNVQTAHTIVIIENPQYTLTSASHVQGVTITPATATVYGRQDITFNISGELGEAVVLDNNINVTTQLRANATGRTYTISNVQSSHTIVVTEPSQESDYIKIAGQFKKVLGFYKKVNGVWTLIEKAAFDEQVSSGISFFGGVIENTVIGDVETSGGAINISINDGSLDSGSYKMVYEDVNRTPITGYTNINEFTIQ